MADCYFSIFDFLVLCFLLGAWLQYHTDAQQGPCRQIDFRRALAFEGSRLVNHVISTINFVEEDFCGALCFVEHNCVSFNMGVTSGSTTAIRCELNNSTHLEHPDDLKPWNNYSYRGIKNPCGKIPCQNHATCQAGFTNKGYRCLCVSGFNGHDCETDVDECFTGHMDCDVNAVCTNTKGSYNCTCKEGYYGDGRNCTDVDECKRNLDPCHTNATCENTIGSHKCSCKAGFTGDGYSCKGCPAGWAASKVSCYYIVGATFTSMRNDRQECQGMDEDLPIINSPEENTFIAEFLKGQGLKRAWIGLRRNDADKNFYWFDSTPIKGNYESWRAGEPNNRNGNENCALIVVQSSHGVWNDIPREKLWAATLCQKAMQDR